MSRLQIGLEYFTELNTFSIISFIFAIITCSFGFYAYGKSSKSKTGRILLALCISIAIWILAYAFELVADPNTSVWFWYYFSSFGFLPMWPLLIHFLATLSGFDKDYRLKKTLHLKQKTFVMDFYSILIASQYILMLIILLRILAGNGEPSKYVETKFGLHDRPPENSSNYILFLIAIFFWYIASAILVILFYKKSHKKNASIDMRLQSSLITGSGIVLGTLAMISNIVLPMFSVDIPSIGSIFIGLWILCITAANVKYNLGAQSELLIGQNSFNFTKEPMLVTDPDLTMIYANNAFESAFCSITSLVPKRITDLFENPKESNYFEKLINTNSNSKKLTISNITMLDCTGARCFYNIEAVYIYNQNILDRILFIFNDITEIAEQNEKLSQKIRDSTQEIRRQLSITGTYIRPSLAKIIKEGKDPTKLEPENKEFIVLFTDIRNFTAMSEKLSPYQTLAFLNSYYSTMNSCITDNNGEIDKLIGDCIMALFETSDDAINASIQLFSKLKQFNSTQTFVEYPINIGIGISRGLVTRGNIGSVEKLDYTVIGDTVNTACRLESLTKDYKTPLLLSESIVDSLKPSHRHHLRFVDYIQLRGKEHPIKIYELFDYNDDKIISLKEEIKSEMEQPFNDYQIGNFEKAIIGFSTLNKKHDNQDPLIGVYIKRCENLIEQKKYYHLENWNGIYHF